MSFKLKDQVFQMSLETAVSHHASTLTSQICSPLSEADRATTFLPTSRLETRRNVLTTSEPKTGMKCL